MIAHKVCPPTGFRRNITNPATPFGRRQIGAQTATHDHLSLVKIKVGKSAQQQGLARTRRPSQRQALTSVNVK